MSRKLLSQLFGWFLVIFIFVSLGLTGYVHYLERHNIFYPSKQISQTPREIGLAFEDIFFTTEDNVVLNGWLISGESQKPMVIFLHGNAGNISSRLEKIQIFHELGLNIFIIDYRGYGKSYGQPSEQGIYADAKAAYDHLKYVKKFVHNKVIVYGESLGGAVATDLAVARSVDGLIIDSSFTNAQDMAQVIYPLMPGFLVNVGLDSINKIQRLNMPKLMIHSVEDDIVPFRLGKKLFDAASEPKIFLEIQGSHNEGFLTSKEKYVKGISDFLLQFNPDGKL